MGEGSSGLAGKKLVDAYWLSGVHYSDVIEIYPEWRGWR